MPIEIYVTRLCFWATLGFSSLAFATPVPLNNTQHSYQQNVVYAVNLGGSQYTATDGIIYQADTLKTKSQSGQSTAIKGSQDSALYRSYRLGNMSFDVALPPAIYDITFKFAEPTNTPVGQRVFDVIAQQQVVIPNLDVRLARDGKALSSLDRTVTDIEVTDGILTVELKGHVGLPVLHAIIIRQKQVPNTQWKLVWQDEFEQAGAPNPEKWNFDIWPAGKVNNEDQAYTNRLKNARVEHGKLILEAHKEKYSNANYTSARLNSAHKGDLLYGRADIRAKLASGQGSWSALWMLPTNPFKYATRCKPDADWQGSETCDAWPNSGEIDIMEHVGYDMNRIHSTVHNLDYYWIKWEQRKASIEGKNVAEDFHVYSIEWTPSYITILFDNVPYFFYVNEGNGWQSWPFDHPFHIVMNLAIGGDWGKAGGPIDDAIFPARMEIDYVRLFKPAASVE
ncbi:malectin domain-containing carbohydrate-binding protein [Echinimonas agarilytica]|uniref:Family 16 glycosylhydrolase n=1 Tax=Echinimonas agarilytica TaxID=1215918 RepID=A0AA42B687_9GAMM|nr:family 16 glycosylhydrolase [Echinimonas agarilytica]MCM2678369.1 family 16 glycosylhydrolase [Echinimonas agarilytica]